MRWLLMLPLAMILVACSENKGWEQKAAGDFAGCASSFGAKASELAQSYPYDTMSRSVNLNEAAECAEASQNQQLALLYYQQLLSLPPRDGDTYQSNARVRIAALRSGRPLLAGNKLQADAQAFNAEIAQSRDERNAQYATSSQTAMAGMMAGMIEQPTYAPGRRARPSTSPSTFSPGYQTPENTSSTQSPCPPPTVSRSPNDGHMNSAWINVNSNCSHSVYVTIHTVHFYPALRESRVERTVRAEIGRSASFSCDGKREGCVVEMVGYR